MAYLLEFLILYVVDYLQIVKVLWKKHALIKSAVNEINSSEKNELNKGLYI